MGHVMINVFFVGEFLLLGEKKRNCERYNDFSWENGPKLPHHDEKKTKVTT